MNFYSLHRKVTQTDATAICSQETSDQIGRALSGEGVVYPHSHINHSLANHGHAYENGPDR